MVPFLLEKFMKKIMEKIYRFFEAHFGLLNDLLFNYAFIVTFHMFGHTLAGLVAMTIGLVSSVTSRRFFRKITFVDYVPGIVGMALALLMVMLDTINI